MGWLVHAAPSQWWAARRYVLDRTEIIGGTMFWIGFIAGLMVMALLVHLYDKKIWPYN